MLDTKLIEKALSITGKTMEDMYMWKIIESTKFEGIERGRYEEFSIEKFCYYLHDFDFIKKYIKHTTSGISKETVSSYYACLGSSVTLYISGNEEPLTNLLSKI